MLLPCILFCNGVVPLTLYKVFDHVDWKSRDCRQMFQEICTEGCVDKEVYLIVE